MQRTPGALPLPHTHDMAVYLENNFLDGTKNADGEVGGMYRIMIFKHRKDRVFTYTLQILGHLFYNNLIYNKKRVREQNSPRTPDI